MYQDDGSRHFVILKLDTDQKDNIIIYGRRYKEYIN